MNFFPLQIIEKDPSKDNEKISALMREHLDLDLEVEMNIGSEISYVLPEEYVGVFAKLLKSVEENATELGISGYGIASTTMEQVFLK